MKKLYLCLIIILLLSVQTVWAEEGTCGMNVKYTTSGNTIVFVMADKNGQDPYFDYSCVDVFKYDKSITRVDITKNTIHLGQSSWVFSGCSYIEEMNLSELDVSGVTDFNYMFSEDIALKKLITGKWDTSSVKTMQGMFSKCNALESLDISGWDTSRVTNMYSMFYYCYHLTILDLSKWNTSNVTTLSNMFAYCWKLEALNLGGWNTSRVTTMSSMFEYCQGLKNVNGVEIFNTSKVTDMSRMFYGCMALTSLDLSKWNTAQVTSMKYMFMGCRALKRLEVGSWNTSNVTDMSGMFEQLFVIESMSFPKWNTSKVTDMSQMFYDCFKLRILDLSTFETSKVTNSENMFYQCKELVTLTLGSKTLGKNVFTTLPKYQDVWYYITPAKGISNPQKVHTTKSKGALFTGYNYQKMGGTWSTVMQVPVANDITIQNSSGTNVTGQTLRVYNSLTYQLKAVATPSSASQKFTWTTSNSSIATVDSGGKVTFKQSGKKVVITAKTTDGSSRSASVSFYYNLPAPKLTITDTNIRGKNKEIQITVPWDETLLKLEATLYYEEHSQYKGQKVSISPKERMDKNGKNKVINFVGSPLENGKVYKFKIRVYNGKWSNSVEKYAMPIANVEGATVVPGNLDMVINISHREPADGTRYMIFDGVTEKEVDYKMGWSSNTTSRFSPLTNGKLYYAVAVPFRDYLGQRLWGPNQNRIYFIPMAVPTGVNVKFSGSNATVSFSSDKYSDGILTLYRTEGGALKHGCESSGTSCTIKGLNSSTGYEFYVLRYQVENGKKYYSRAYRFKYRLKVPDNVDVPQGDVRVVMKNSGYTTFSIRYMNNTYGIAALYKEKDGAFRTACEKLGNSCSANLDVTKNYTFCIMQYKVIKGTKVYSNGIIAHDFSNSKDPEFERLYTGFTPVDESVIMDEIADALEYYLTEDDFLVAEALADMGEGMVTKHFEEFYEDDDFDYSSFDDDLDEFPIMKDSSIEDKVPELVEDEGLYMYRIGDKDDFYPVPSFGNQR